jgi:hypothetical protein
MIKNILSRRLDLALTFLFLAIAAACAYQVIAHPLARMQGIAYLVLFVSAMLGFGYALSFWPPMSKTGGRLRRFALGLLQCVIAFVLAVATLRGVDNLTHRHALSMTQEAFYLLIQRIESGEAISASAAAQALFAVNEFQRVALHRGTAIALIESDAGSLDIDGSLIYFLWPQRTWHRFHHDSDAGSNADRRRYEEVLALASLRIDCVRDVQAWKCQETKPNETQAGLGRLERGLH